MTIMKLFIISFALFFSKQHLPKSPTSFYKAFIKQRIKNGQNISTGEQDEAGRLKSPKDIFPQFTDYS